ncbi:MAG: DUF4465 domain-containing protein [Chitinophagaceae bacterium]|nr:DUF4465 domain-containing protein [Chitinophagaceae bacterium]
MQKTLLFISLFILSFQAGAQITFESLSVPTSGYWKGLNTVPLISGFGEGPLYLVNAWDTSWGGSWSGWGYSNRKDTTDISYATNELASMAGSGYNNSDNYTVFYRSYTPEINKIRISNGIGAAHAMGSCYITNTTIAYRSMQNGDGFAKKFGGPSGNDPDFFRLDITGWFNGVPKSDTVKFYLADFRDANNANDYIIKDWTLVNLSSLGFCDSLTFSMVSSDTNSLGMLTPAYFCMDNFSAAIVGIDEWPTSLNVEVYPNPFTEYLYVKNASELAIPLVVRDIYGKVRHAQTAQAQITTPILLSDLSSGVYFIQVQYEGKVFTKKIIK